VKQNLRLKLSALALLAALGLAAGYGLAAERNTPRVETVYSTVKAGARVYAGQVVGAAGGYGYVLTSAATNLMAIGVAQNSAISNGLLIARSGVFGLQNDGTVTAAHIGQSAYAATNDTGYTVSAEGLASYGTITAVDSDYVWVRCGL